MMVRILALSIADLNLSVFGMCLQSFRFMFVFLLTREGEDTMFASL